MQSFGGQADMALFCALVPIALRPAVSGGLPTSSRFTARTVLFFRFATQRPR